MKHDLLQARRWLLPKSMKDLLFEWFVEKETTTNSKHSQKIFEEIMELCKQYKKQEPIVQVELSLWKMACLLNPSTSNINTKINNKINNNKIRDDNFDAVDYFVRGGWKKNKPALRHDPMIAIVITNVLPFLTTDDYNISSARADYLDDDILTVIVSSAGCDEVNGIYRRQYGKRYTTYDAPVFTKPGEYEGHDITYSIYKYGCNPRWFISILPTDDPGKGVDIDFYFNNNTMDMDAPPTTNWETCDGSDEEDENEWQKGIHPPPLIILVKGVVR